MELVRLKYKPFQGDYSQVGFTDSDSNILKLDKNIFLKPDNKIKPEFKDLFKLILENPEYQRYIIETKEFETGTHLVKTIVKITEMPNLTKNLAEFYIRNSRAENFALVTQKYGRSKKNKLEYMKEDRSGLFHKYDHEIHYQPELISKQLAILEQLKSQNNCIVSNTLKQHWRMTIGLGNASAYNNGFTFHPVFGIPYIPGQNVKGILRNWIIKECYNKEEKAAEKDPDFCYFLGCSEKSFDKTARFGKLHFFDSFPSGEFDIVPDIMNPHYSEYYKDSNPEPPHDAQKPKLIFFLSIINAEFTFSFSLQKRFDDIVKSPKLLKCLKMESIEKQLTASQLFNKILIEALEFKGIGAKNRVGYGRFIQQ